MPVITAGERRGRYLINRIQTRYVVVQLCWTAALLALFACLVFGPATYDLFGGNAERQRTAAAAFLDLHTHVWPALMALAAALSALVVMQSHRVIGPLVRFKAVFEAVARGELWVPSKIRAGDYPEDESRALDAMLASLRQRIGDAQRSATALEAAMRQSPPAPAVDVCAALDRLQHCLRVYEVNGPPTTAPAPPGLPIPLIPPADAGFTLIEILLVVTLVGVLAGIAVPGYQAALEKARVTRAIGDIRTVQNEVQSHGLTNGCFPDTLADIGYAAMRDPWGSAYSYAVLDASPGGGACAACGGACIGRGQARKDRNLVPINSDFDLFSPGKDRRSVGPLAANASHDDIVRASDGGFIGLGRDY